MPFTGGLGRKSDQHFPQPAQAGGAAIHHRAL